MRRQFSALALATFLTCVPAAEQASAQNIAPPNAPAKPSVAGTPATPDYVIGPQDILDISVWGEPQFDIKVTVRPDGKIGVKLLSDVQAGGLTTKQVEKLITEGLAPIVPNAHVTVIVIEIRSQMVTVMGIGITRTGAYPLGGPTRVVDLLARAGLNEFAKKSTIAIIRDEGNNRFTKLQFNYDTFVKGNYSQNIFLRNGDTVIVP